MTTKIPVELSSTPGIVDNSNATAITIDSSENVTFSSNVTLSDDLLINGTGTAQLKINGATGSESILRFYDGGSESWMLRQTNSDNVLSFRRNSNNYLSLSASGVVSTVGDVTVGGNLTVQGTTTTLNTATLDVEDKNITLNAGSGDTSGSANGAGITIQDAVDASTDASLTWRASDDKFIFSHPLRMFGNLELPDNVKLAAGDGNDLQIYHDGSHSYVDNDTGSLYIRSPNSIQLENSDGSEDLATFAVDGAVTLYHNGSAKLATNSGGVTVTGNVVASGVSQFADVNIPDNNAIRFGNSQDLQIYHDGSNSVILNNTGRLDLRAANLAFKNTTNNETYATFTENGAVNLYYNNVLKFLTSSTGINLPIDGDSIKFGANSEIILTHVHDVGLSLTGALSITGDGSNATTLTESGSGDFTVDSAGNIVLNADGGGVQFYDGSDYIGSFGNSSTNFSIMSRTNDKDIIFKGIDGGSTITALTLDMSNAGKATFNNAVVASGISQFADVNIPDNNAIRFGNSQDLQIYHDGTNGQINAVNGNLTLDVAGDITLDADGGDIYLEDAGTRFGYFTNSSTDLFIGVNTQDKDILFKGNDGGSGITALRLDMSEAGTATFNNAINVNGDLKFNSGYGSSVIGYGVRAWVNFNGTGTVAIRDHGNVSSITDNGTGDYTVNFATALPDTNYCVVGSGIQITNHPTMAVSISSVSGAQATGSLRIIVGVTGGAGSVGIAADGSIISVAVIR